eukprot:GHUV01014432.1.p2 GENE.GHUV01014432.1~~GHUV01014432.1.p2  ORF type:complete len:115 (+),score=27.43 GHUV01014432.1:722-1066(+)
MCLRNHNIKQLAPGATAARPSTAQSIPPSLTAYYSIRNSQLVRPQFTQHSHTFSSSSQCQQAAVFASEPPYSCPFVMIRVRAVMQGLASAAGTSVEPYKGSSTKSAAGMQAWQP